MGEIFTFLFNQLSAFSSFLTETVFGQLILAGMMISFVVFLISVVISFGKK